MTRIRKRQRQQQRHSFDLLGRLLGFAQDGLPLLRGHVGWCQFQNGIVPEWEKVTGKGYMKILWGLGKRVVLYWELRFMSETRYHCVFALMCWYLEKEFQFGT